jgi:Fe-S cluster biogenesis protein NfuA
MPTAHVSARLAEVNRILGAHAGGVELIEVDDRVARLRFTGMCTGCPLRPVTTASTIRPALAQLPEIDHVEIEGSRVSRAAETRLARAFRSNSQSIAPWPDPGHGDPHRERNSG